MGTSFFDWQTRSMFDSASFTCIYYTNCGFMWVYIRFLNFFHFLFWIISAKSDKFK